MTKMAELGNFESINGNLAEIKELISEVKNNMMSGENCNNQFYTIIQTLDNIVTNIDNIGSNNKPSDEYTILQTNILEVRKELSRMNTNIDETICDGLKVLLSKLSEKVNRLEILTNNAGIDQQVVMNSTNQLEKILSQKMKEAYDTLYAQGISSTEAVREDVADINNNIKECVEYLECSVKAVSADAVQHLSDDMTVLGTTIEKTTDNLKRSVIDLFSRIQDSVSKNDGYNSSVETSKTFDKDIEMLKNGIYNLNANTEQRIDQLTQLIEELDVFKKLESFAKLKDLPAIGDLKHSLENNINRIVDEYSYILQTSKNKDKLDNVKYQFRKNIYNEIISMLGNVSEYLIETDYANHSSSIQNVEHSSQLENFSERIEELTSVTELNNSGYDDIQIELKNLRERCNLIFDVLKKILKDETIFKINNNLTEIQTQNNF
ncbi:MAG: hypothetical protein LUB59_04320, partial [Candidatus Gastranaerophilales bacterium]|nr:hypothetical protein [Candidatus Gastranaerophilales bacterium]